MIEAPLPPDGAVLLAAKLRGSARLIEAGESVHHASDCYLFFGDRVPESWLIAQEPVALGREGRAMADRVGMSIGVTISR